jgi:glutamate synthase (NADPH/NADH) small chain
LDIRREEPGYRSREERLRDFRPVEQRLSEEEVRRQAARCMDCGTPFCHGCGCPLRNVIPELNDLVYRGRWKEALEVLLATNNFPEFTGRVCPALCEAACVAGIHDEPVTIRQVELAIVETAFEKGIIRPRPPSKRLPTRVAVIGSGPAGLAVADTLNRAGHTVTVYDRAAHPGGVLRYGIPDFKLDKGLIDRRIRLMNEEGVAFEMGLSVGEDVSYNYLRGRFDAVCLTGGSREPRDLAIPGRELKGVYFAMEYLTQQNRINAGERVEPSRRITAEGKDVVVIGGGDTGADCLGTALRQGARAVRQFEILPEPPASRPERTPWPMWPDIRRDSSSHKEGGIRRWNVSTKRFLGDHRLLTGLRAVEVEWVAGPGGRNLPRDKPGTEFDTDAQLVLLALGFIGPGRNKLVSDLDIALDERGNIKVDARHMTSVEGVFAAGDTARGQSLVVRAIADGREAAKGIGEYLRTKGPAPVADA